MITIVGGKIQSALGQGSQKIDALRTGRPKVGTIEVSAIDEQLTYPYYHIDETRRLAHPSVVDTYLDRAVNGLLKKLTLKPSDLKNIGLFLGSSSIDYSLVRPIEQDIDNGHAATCKRERVGGGNYLESLMERFAFAGPALTYNTACTSSANGLLDAASMLEGGIIDHAMVLGLELYSPTTLEGFSLMQLLSPEAARPFDQNRNGMVLGEAVSAVLLSRNDIIPSPWYYLGGKSNCEIYSVTGAEPGGEGIAQVMHAALEDAGIMKNTITAVKTHGTASELMDLAEMRAMERLFEPIPPYFSLKEYLGHTLGGCGVAELVLMMESIDAGFIPPTVNFKTLDSEFRTAPVQEVLPVQSGHFMLNYFGFGGNNISFVIEKTAT